MNRTIKLNHLTENALDLDDSNTYQCRVWHYSHSHSVLIVQIHKAGGEKWEPEYLVFENVLYYEGPMCWSSANLRITSLEEYMEFMIEKKWIAGAACLCIFEGTNATVKLSATNHITITDDLTAFKHYLQGEIT
jgi:hypothetical protein